MTENEEKEVHEIIKKAACDLEDMYCKIKKSHKILKYQSNGNLLNEIYSNIIAHFVLLQILENSGKSKMVDNKKNKELSRRMRFVVLLNDFIDKFNDMAKQHIKLLDSKNE